MTRRIISLIAEGFDVEAWIKFADKVFANPLDFARDELYLWLETNSMPITPDGNIVAYKKVRNDYRDIYSGRFDNSPGRTVTLPGGRDCVDKDRDRTCSTGLHFCSASYLPSFGMGTGNRVVIVEIDPRDVVSIPSDYNNAKGRCWKYKVVGEVPPEEAAEMIWPAVTSFDIDYNDDYDGDEDIEELSNRIYDLEEELSEATLGNILDAAAIQELQDRIDELETELSEATTLQPLNPAPIEDGVVTQGVMRRIQTFIRRPR
jgi:hypothetical protein